MARALKRIFFLPDAHVPHHSTAAFQIAIRACKRFDPDILVVLGDFADFYSVSSHDKDPARTQLLSIEIRAVRSCLAQLEALDVKRKIFLMGNHEYRLQRYLCTRAPELFDMVEVHKLFELEENGWEWVPYREHLMLGSLALSHDFGSAGQTAHSKAAIKLGSSIVMGHTHRMAYVTRSDIRRQLISAAMFGWLGDFSAIDYASKASVTTDWVHGFGVGYLYRNDIPILCPVPIIDERFCVLEGEMIR